MARDATARLYDVDANSVMLDKKAATITFRARPGRSVDLDRLHESIWATRLGDRTGMELHRLDVTAEGEVVVVGTEVRLKMPDSDRYFILGDGTRDGEREPLRQLKEALERGEKVTGVTGRVDGWNGNFTRLLSKLPAEPRRIIVKEFRTARP